MTTLKLKRPLAVFDIEATGVSPQTDRIVELAIIRLFPDGSRDTHTYRINPGIPIPVETTMIHGISDADVRNCPRFSDLAPAIMKIFENADLCGFNVSRFDIPMLVEEMGRAGHVFDLTDRHVLDAQRIFHRKEPRDLTAALAFYCNELHLDAHGALPDVDATIRVLEAQLGRYEDLPRDPEALDGYCNVKDPSWADRTGRLKWVNNQIVLNFGKKKGVALKTLVEDDPSFIKWMLRSDFPRDVKEIIEAGQQGNWPTPPA
ncbi:MAG: 3'-5' exonuclease [Verrucomicrobia bacterium]|nr:3'-5' exonuclease [Verrucomicrobiota bacterium]